MILSNADEVHNPPRWSKPPPGATKINWDASIDQACNRMGLGVVVRDSSGELRGSLFASVHGITDLDVAEAMAAWRAANLCIVQGFQSVILEGDSTNIVNALRMKGSCWTQFG